MTDFSTTIASFTTDPRFLAAVAVTVISGLVRGFSGFGSALIYIPLVAAIYNPRVAALTFLITDYIASTPLTIMQTRHCNWREVAPVSIAAIATVPLGVAALQYLDPVVLRWFIAFLVIGLLLALISGWRYRNRPTLPASIGVGLMSGIGAGAVQVSGPPVIVYWLGGPNTAAVVRANLIVFFGIVGFAVGVLYYVRGLFAADVVMLSLLLGPLYIFAIAVGAYMFRESSEQMYRRTSYIIIALSALVSLPLFDELFR